jgi:kynurenine formamidase
MTSPLLLAVAKGIAGGAIRVIDLTQTLTPEFPTITPPPELGQCAPFRLEEISHYDERGPGWYWNNFSMGEHTGTHFDAPIHWKTGRDLPNNSVDAIPPEHFIAPACVIDVSREAAADPDFMLAVPDIERWEEQHGRVPQRSWILLRTDWSKRDPRAYANLQDDGAHTPGPGRDAVRWLVEERDVHGFGTETIGTDAGQAQHFNPPFPVHHFMHGKGRYGLQCLINLDQLPPTARSFVRRR